MNPSIEVNEVEREDRDDLTLLMRRYGNRYPIRGSSEVLGRMWFYRLWTVQEICLASKAVFICGSHALCFDSFRSGLLYYNIWNKACNETPGVSNRDLAPANLPHSMSNAAPERRPTTPLEVIARHTRGLAQGTRREIDNLQLLAPPRYEGIEKGCASEEPSLFSPGSFHQDT